MESSAKTKPAVLLKAMAAGRFEPLRHRHLAILARAGRHLLRFLVPQPSQVCTWRWALLEVHGNTAANLSRQQLLM